MACNRSVSRTFCSVSVGNCASVGSAGGINCSLAEAWDWQALNNMLAKTNKGKLNLNMLISLITSDFIGNRRTQN